MLDDMMLSYMILQFVHEVACSFLGATVSEWPVDIFDL